MTPVEAFSFSFARVQLDGQSSGINSRAEPTEQHSSLQQQQSDLASLSSLSAKPAAQLI